MSSPLSVTRPKTHIRPGPHFTCMDDIWASDCPSLRSSHPESAQRSILRERGQCVIIGGEADDVASKRIGAENNKPRFGGKVAATSHGWSKNEPDMAFLYGPGAAMEMAAAFCRPGSDCGIAWLLQGVRRVRGECGSSGLCVSAASNHAGSTAGNSAQAILNRFLPGCCRAGGAAPHAILSLSDLH
jgi:hypothetical protein